MAGSRAEKVRGLPSAAFRRRRERLPGLLVERSVSGSFSGRAAAWCSTSGRWTTWSELERIVQAQQHVEPWNGLHPFAKGAEFEEALAADYAELAGKQAGIGEGRTPRGLKRALADAGRARSFHPRRCRRVPARYWVASVSAISIRASGASPVAAQVDEV